MIDEIWWLACLTVFFCAVQFCLGGRSQRSLDEARMLPFADDPEVAARMERATRLSRTGCSCPGECSGNCQHHQRVEM